MEHNVYDPRHAHEREAKDLGEWIVKLEADVRSLVVERDTARDECGKWRRGLLAVDGSLAAELAQARERIGELRKLLPSITRETNGDVWIAVTSPTGEHGALNLRTITGPIARAAFLGWANGVAQALAATEEKP